MSAAAKTAGTFSQSRQGRLTSPAGFPRGGGPARADARAGPPPRLSPGQKRRRGKKPRRRFCMADLEIDFRIVEAALEQLFHYGRRDFSRVRAGAGIADGELRDFGQLVEEFLLVNDAALIILDAGGNIQLLVQLLDAGDERVGQRLVVVAGQTDEAGDVRIALQQQWGSWSCI